MLHFAENMYGVHTAFVPQQHQREQGVRQILRMFQAGGQLGQGERIKYDAVGFLARQEVTDECLQSQCPRATQRGEIPGLQGGWR